MRAKTASIQYALYGLKSSSGRDKIAQRINGKPILASTPNGGKGLQ